MLVLHVIRIELGKLIVPRYDLLSEIPIFIEEIGLTRIPHYTVLRTPGLVELR